MHEAGLIAAYLLFIIPVSYYDLRYRRIPDLLAYPALAFLGMYQLLICRLAPAPLLIGAVGAFGLLLLCRLVTGGGIGWGDLKLGALNGLFLAPWLWLAGLAVACGAALLLFLPRTLRRKIESRYKIPFAPFLGGGALVIKLLEISELL